MNPSYYFPIMFLLFVVVMSQRRRKRQILQKLILKNKKQKRKGDGAMVELAKKMIGKECLIYTFNETQLKGTVTAVDGAALLLDNGKEEEVVNLDYVVRIREYPKNKNGKKKSVVID